MYTCLDIAMKIAWNEGHIIDWEGCRILDREDQWRRREHLESFHIFQKISKLNRDRGTLSEQYFSAIRHRPTVCHSLRNLGINDNHRNSNNTWESQSGCI